MSPSAVTPRPRRHRTRPSRRRALAAAILGVTCALAAFNAPSATAQGFLDEASRLAAYRARVDTLVQHFAQAETGYGAVAARLFEGEHLDEAQAALERLMEDPSGDMFWMYRFVLLSYLARGTLSEDVQQRMHSLWRTYTPYRGDTENHWAMYYTSLYLASRLYPGEDASSWFNGKSSAENEAEARDYLLHWIDLTTTKGQGEFDSPHYVAFYVAPMAELYAFADDPAMRLRARMMLDYLFADFAAESLDGLYGGAHSRDLPATVVQPWNAASTSFAWLLFGNAPFRPRLEAFIVAVSGYQPPAILHEIATDRSKPYVHRELKRTRHRIRYSDVQDARVYKYTYVHPDFVLGSMQGGLLQPVQQHTWDLTWKTEGPQDGSNTLFTIHPYSSSHELAMYFPEEPKLLTDAVTKSKGTYDSPDKWTGASPFERVFQHEDALIVLYDIPPGTRFPYVDGYFPKTLKQREVDDSGWIFAIAGQAYVAYYPLAPFTWREEEDDWRLFSPSLKNGAVVQVATASDYARFADFEAAVRALPIETNVDGEVSVRFTTLHGTRLAFTYGQAPSVDGVPLDYSAWKLFDGPFLYAEPGSGRLLLRHGKMRRLLDFTIPAIRTWSED